MRFREYPRRVAMISMHTSPLETPGVGDAGGLNVYVAELSRRLAARGVELDVFTRRTDPEQPEIVEVRERVRVIHLPAGRPEPVTKEELPDLIGEFADAMEMFASRYEMIHSHYWLSGMVGIQVAGRRRLPLVHTMHTMARVKNAAREDDHVIEPGVRERGEAAIVQQAQVLTANTPAEARQLHELYGAGDDQVVVVPPGVDLGVFHPCDQVASRNAYDVPLDAQVILFVGRIQPLKAPHVLIEAVAELIKDDPERRKRLKLIIIGGPSGPDAEWAATLPMRTKEHGLDDVIIFRPHAERAELFRWYCVSDVVGVPSYNESFGLVALEAQACGRPVVATDVGGLRHAVDDGHTGVLVQGHDPRAWASALASVLDNPERAAELGLNAAGHAARFSWDNSAAATLAAYHLAQEALD